MRQYHMISAKRMGWDQIYDYYLFPTDRYTKKSALAEFYPVTKETMKIMGNGINIPHMSLEEKHTMILYTMEYMMKVIY